MRKFLIGLYSLVLLASLVFVVYVYGIDFDNNTETDLVNYSYAFVPAIVFSIVGLTTSKIKFSILIALGSGVGALALLFAFFQGIWPML